MNALSESEFEQVKSSLNNAIHELVFAVQHAGDDNFDGAGNCLMTAQGTIESVAELLVSKEKK